MEAMKKASRTGALLAVARHIAAPSFVPTVIDVEKPEEEGDDARKKRPRAAHAAKGEFEVKVKPPAKGKVQVKIERTDEMSEAEASEDENDLTDLQKTNFLCKYMLCLECVASGAVVAPSGAVVATSSMLRLGSICRLCSDWCSMP